MRDPHVEFLLYSVSAEGAREYIDPEPLEFEHVLGRFRIDGGKLKIEPAEHFGNVREARDAIGPFLEAWEIETDLVVNPGTIRFRFKRAKVIERDPSSLCLPMMVRTLSVSCDAVVVQAVSRRSYPQPPAAFWNTPEAEIAFRRWRGYRDGKEHLPAMAYFVLTLLKQMARGLKQAAEKFKVDYKILHKLSELSSTAGDAATARKVGQNMQFRDLSGSEKEWIEQVVRRLIRRLGERTSEVEQITTGDLPLP